MLNREEELDPPMPVGAREFRSVGARALTSKYAQSPAQKVVWDKYSDALGSTDPNIRHAAYEAYTREYPVSLPPKLTAEEKLEEKIDNLRDRIERLSNADNPNDDLISKLEQQRDAYQAKYDLEYGG